MVLHIQCSWTLHPEEPSTVAAMTALCLDSIFMCSLICLRPGNKIAGMQGSPVKSSTLLDVSGAVPEEVIQNLITACKSRLFANIKAATSEAIADGWPVRLSCIQGPPDFICICGNETWLHDVLQRFHLF